MNSALSALLSHPAIWRGGDCAPEPDALPTGFAALDQVLPGGGWPGNALTEIVLAREGIGELRLTLPTLAALTNAGREVVWVAPPYTPHAPALAAAGIALRRLALVRCRTPQEALWTFDQALRAPECGAAFAWLPEHDERVLRRLAVAAREGRTWGVLWRRPGVRAQAIAAPLRLALDAQDGQLAVKVLKRRGGELAKPIRVDLAARWSTAATEAIARAPVDAAASRAHATAVRPRRRGTRSPERRRAVPRRSPPPSRRGCATSRSD
jgi:cell division inhibitor SulA